MDAIQGSAPSLNQTSWALPATGGEPGDRAEFRTVAPSNGVAGRNYTGHSASQAQDLARAVHDAFRSSRRTTFVRWGELMREAAAVLRRRQLGSAK